MSVLIKIKNIKTLLNVRENIELLVSTQNEEISFLSLISVEQKEVGSFLIDNKIKKIQFIVKQQQRSFFKAYANCQFFLYDFCDLANKPIIIRKLGLNRQQNEIKNNTYQDQIYDEYLVVSLEFKSKRRILKQIQKISELPSLVPKIVQQPSIARVQNEIDKPVYQQINLLSEIEQNQPKDNTINFFQSKMKQKAELKIETKIFVSLEENNLMQQKKTDNLLFQIQNNAPNALGNIFGIHPQLQQKRDKNLKKKNREQSDRPQIFERLTQKDHIGINTNTNTFQIYNMCCGDQIDYSNQIQQSY